MGKDPLPPEWEDDGDRSWIDENTAPNGIGPVCQYCRQLIDWHPVDHALDCERYGPNNGM